PGDEERQRERRRGRQWRRREPVADTDAALGTQEPVHRDRQRARARDREQRDHEPTRRRNTVPLLCHALLLEGAGIPPRCAFAPAKEAERVGFEPTVGVTLHTLSKSAPSATRTPPHEVPRPSQSPDLS